MIKVINLGWCLGKIVFGKVSYSRGFMWEPESLTIVSPECMGEGFLSPATSISIGNAAYIKDLRDALKSIPGEK